MKAKIGVELLRSDKVKPKDKPFEIYDTELKGFTLRIQPDWYDKTGKKMPGVKSYLVRYRLPNGKQTRTIIGSHKEFTPAQARDKATEIRRAVKNEIDPAQKEQPAVNHTFQSFLNNEYSPWAEANRKDGKATIKRLKMCFAEFNEIPLSGITALDAEKWRTERLKKGKQPATCNRDLTALTGC